MMRSRDGHTGAGKTWLARATVLAVGAATLTVPLGIITGAEAARIQPRTSTPTSTLAVVKTILSVGNPEAVAVNNEDDTVYVTNNLGGNMSVINGRTATSTTVNLGGGTRPTGVAVDQSDDTVYVSIYNDNSVRVINGRNLDDSSIVSVGNFPQGIAVDQGDDTVYVALNGATGNNVRIINGRNVDDSSTVKVTNWPWGIAVDQGDDTVYVTSEYGGDVLSSINGRNLDDSSNTPVGADPKGVAVDQNDDTVYVVNYGTNLTAGTTVSVINGRTRQNTNSDITVGTRPYGVAVDQNDDTVYVTNEISGNLSVINGRTGQRTDDTVSVDSKPHGVAVDDSGTNAGLVYVANNLSNTVSVVGRVTPSLASPSGAAGSTATINLNVPQVDYDVDNSTISSVSFGGTPATGLAAGAGDTWTVTVPAGTGTVAVTVTFDGGRSASAGDFTYDSTPTPPPAPTPASAPLDVTATAGDASATVSWKAPTSSGDYPVTTYKATSSPGGRTCLVAAPSLTCEVTGLTNGTAYTFTVQALTGAGWGATSSSSNAVTPRATPKPSITITGSRSGQRIVVTGTATDLAGKSLRPWTRFPGQKSFTAGTAAITPAADGTFTWSRKSGKRTSVYIAHESTRSNTVTIAAR